MSQHPAAAIVELAVQKIAKLTNSRKYQLLQESCQKLLDDLPALLQASQDASAPGSTLSPVTTIPQLSASQAALQHQTSVVSQGRRSTAGGAGTEESSTHPVEGTLADDASQAQVQAVSPAEVKEHFSPEELAEAAKEGLAEAANILPAAAPEPESGKQSAGVSQAQIRLTVPDTFPRTDKALNDEALTRIVAVLRLAASTERPNVIEIALDCITQLIAFKFLQGAVIAVNVDKPGQEAEADKQAAGPSAEDPSSRSPQAQAVELMCRCDEIPDDKVELAVLKGLLTSAVSPVFTLHSQALLVAVRTCYNIYIMSRSDQNQVTAKAILTQVLFTALNRMEPDYTQAKIKPVRVADVMGISRANTDPEDQANVVAANIQGWIDNVIMVASTTPHTEEPRPSQVQPDVGDAAGLQPTSTEHSASSTAGQDAGEGSEGGSTPGRHTHLHTPSTAEAFLATPAPEEAAPKGVHHVHSRQSLVVSPLAPQTPEQQQRSAVFQKDAFLIFRTLCKLSIRTNEPASTQDVAAIRGKVLALELLKVMLDHSGPTFRKGETFISGIRQHLCLSLLKNSSSSIPAALQLSCSIFLTLLSKFRTHLKAEISVFFPMILLKPFEPPQIPGATAATAAQLTPPPTPASIQYKGTILRVLSEVCRDGQLVVDLFVNYDCDLESSNLFERMVHALVRTAQQPPVAQPPSPLIVDTGNTYQQEQQLRYEALQALVQMVEAMLYWLRLTSNLVEVDLGMSMTDIARPAQLDAPKTGSPAATDASSATGLSRDVGNASTPNLADAEGGNAAGTGEPGGEDLTAKRQYKLTFQNCINKFNKKPREGIRMLQAAGMLGTEAEEIAQFLLKNKDLNRTMIGDYLGERDDFNIRVMHAYVDLLEFHALEFDAAIRLFLAGFRLPGEAQKIDRLMEKFAERFLKCNPGSFKSADVAYILAYSVIMLNTDLHNPQVKKKMAKEDFIRNNRGINDGQDLPQEFLSDLFDRIAANEIKMKEDGPMNLDAQANAAQSRNLLTTLLSILGMQKEARSDVDEEGIKRTMEFLHEKARGSLAVTVTEPDALKPMAEVIWAPLLGALSVLFDEYQDIRQVSVCLQGVAVTCCLAAQMGKAYIRNVYIHSLGSFAYLNLPHLMKRKHALAFSYLVRLAMPDNIGNQMGDRWEEVLRAISRWELLQQKARGKPTDMDLFSQSDKTMKSVLKKVFDNEVGGKSFRSLESLGVNEASLHKLSISGSAVTGAFTRRGGDDAQIQPDIVNSVSEDQLSEVFTKSSQLDSEAVVAFVRALCTVSRAELEDVEHPRVFSLRQLVEVAHYNMTRIRLVWTRIWAVLSDYFIEVGCHPNLKVAMYAVDSLRQLAMKFLERDELANYTFQTDFLRPFVVVMRHSQAVEIRDMIIRCLSQMVLARVDNVKSGWKSMFMVFTTAAGDKEPQIVNLAFDTIEKIVREHFAHITETETTTFTDCVNCLIAFTNNPHSSTVALNSIAFLRYCAVKLAEGAIGDVNELPEGLSKPAHQPVRLVALESKQHDNTLGPAGGSHNQQLLLPPDGLSQTSSQGLPGSPTAAAASMSGVQGEGVRGVGGPAALRARSLRPGTSGGRGQGADRGSAVSNRSAGLSSRTSTGQEPAIKFVDRDEHVYFWFPLLAGLSELTFDPRDQIRSSSLEVLFDTLKSHGSSFAASFWRRVFDSVLMPMFDHVRAEVTDTTTFSDDKKREKEDQWLYETCKRCLQHLVDVFVMFYDETSSMLPQLLQLLGGFINRSHQNLAGGGVYALAHLVTTAARKLDAEAWNAVAAFLLRVAQETTPDAFGLVPAPPASTPQTVSLGNASSSSPSLSPVQQPYQNGVPSFPSPVQNGAATPASMQYQQQPAQQLSHPSASTSGAGVTGRSGAPQSPSTQPSYTLREGRGARRLALFRCQSYVQLLLTQSCSDIYNKQHHLMPPSSIDMILQALDVIASSARRTDMDTSLRKRLAMQQAEDKVQDDRVVFDPPLLRLETEASHTYLSILLHINTFATDQEALKSIRAQQRMVELCRSVLARFALGADKFRVQPDAQYMREAAEKHQQIVAKAATQAAETLAAATRGAGFLGVQLGSKSSDVQRRQEKYAAAVAAAAQGRTADRRSIIVGRTSTGVLVLMAAPTVEYAPFTPLINSVLAALSSLDDSTFRSHLHEFFPLMVALISTDYAPVEVLRGLGTLMASRVGPMIGISQAEAAAEMATAAAAVRMQAEQAGMTLLGG